jgi:hypothetical protein
LSKVKRIFFEQQRGDEFMQFPSDYVVVKTNLEHISAQVYFMYDITRSHLRVFNLLFILVDYKHEVVEQVN